MWPQLHVFDNDVIKRVAMSKGQQPMTGIMVCMRWTNSLAANLGEFVPKRCESNVTVVVSEKMSQWSFKPNYCQFISDTVQFRRVSPFDEFWVVILTIQTDILSRKFANQFWGVLLAFPMVHLWQKKPDSHETTWRLGMKRMLSKYWQNKTSKLPNCICAQCSFWNKNDGYSGIKTRVNKYSTIVKFVVLGSIRLETAQICCQNYFMPSFVFSNLVAMCLFPAFKADPWHHLGRPAQKSNEK